ncbi:unnamed protein product (mitochondrion) [Plasmodiophora brassicae]|uniref:Peroxisomal biogenesis factor 11 n=1 Tax=Plasmodiophora brassicae TaxID=37360 RepID=A0A0G4J074_PLABS|nr:hypothetical protein PBRA_008297 [Plasmodiophora brassicae]SPQ95302.1 unnamed protein product [Plasmodiophora brassicae]
MAPAAPKARLVPWWTRPLAYALLQTDGTDKGAKILQYSLRYAHYWATGRVTTDVDKRLQGAIKQMSQSRKVLRLLKCMYSWPAIRDTSWKPPADNIANAANNWIGNVNDMLDDLAFFGSLGFFSAPATSFFEQWADRVWFSSCFFDIFVLLVQLHHVNEQITVLRATRQQQVDTGASPDDTDGTLRKLEAKRAMLWVGLWKMAGDLGVATSYALHLSTSKGAIAVLGLLSASCGFYKLWVKALAAT